MSIFILTVVIIFFSLGTQFVKMYKLKTSNGVSANAYIFGFLSQLTTFIVADNNYIVIISIIGMIGSLTNVFTIYYYNHKNKVFKENMESKLDFILGIISSLFMIFGFSQALKSFKHKGVTKNVSKIAYIFSFLYALMISYMSIDIKVFIGSVISMFLYLFVLYKSIDFKNLKKN